MAAAQPWLTRKGCVTVVFLLLGGGARGASLSKIGSKMHAFVLCFIRFVCRVQEVGPHGTFFVFCFFNAQCYDLANRGAARFTRKEERRRIFSIPGDVFEILFVRLTISEK